MAYEDFYVTVGRRILALQNLPSDFYVSIQKGYYRIGLNWQFSAIASIRMSVNNKQIEAFATTVPTTERSSKIKSNDPSKNFSDLLSEEFPYWNKETDSVYTLLTGNPEKEWLAEPLQNCLTYLMR